MSQGPLPPALSDLGIVAPTMPVGIPNLPGQIQISALPLAVTSGELRKVFTAKEIIQQKQSESKAQYEFRIKVAQAIIDSPYQIIDGLEDSYLTPNAIIELTDYICNRIWYNLSFEPTLDLILDMFMEIADLSV